MTVHHAYFTVDLVVAV